MSEKDFTNQRWSVSNLPADIFDYFEKTFPSREQVDSSRMDCMEVGQLCLIVEANDTYPRRAIPFHCVQSARYQRQDEPEHIVSMDDVHETLRSAIKDIADFIVEHLKALEIPKPLTLLVQSGIRPQVYADRRGSIVHVEAWIRVGVDLWTGTNPPRRQIPNPEGAAA